MSDKLETPAEKVKRLEGELREAREAINATVPYPLSVLGRGDRIFVEAEFDKVDNNASPGDVMFTTEGCGFRKYGCNWAKPGTVHPAADFIPRAEHERALEEARNANAPADACPSPGSVTNAVATLVRKFEADGPAVSIHSHGDFTVTVRRKGEVAVSDKAFEAEFDRLLTSMTASFAQLHKDRHEHLQVLRDFVLSRLSAPATTAPVGEPVGWANVLHTGGGYSPTYNLYRTKELAVRFDASAAIKERAVPLYRNPFDPAAILKCAEGMAAYAHGSEGFNVYRAELCGLLGVACDTPVMVGAGDAVKPEPVRLSTPNCSIEDAVDILASDFDCDPTLNSNHWERVINGERIGICAYRIEKPDIQGWRVGNLYTGDKKSANRIARLNPDQNLTVIPLVALGSMPPDHIVDANKMIAPSTAVAPEGVVREIRLLADSLANKAYYAGQMGFDPNNPIGETAIINSKLEAALSRVVELPEKSESLKITPLGGGSNRVLIQKRDAYINAHESELLGMASELIAAATNPALVTRAQEGE